jgi:hypothetical protein
VRACARRKAAADRVTIYGSEKLSAGIARLACLGSRRSLYFSGFYHRVAPAVMTDQLWQISTSARALGNFTASFLQLFLAGPTGILADHWGPGF